MSIEMLSAGIDALRRIAANEQGIMHSVYIGDERRPESVPRSRAVAAVRLFDQLDRAEKQAAADLLKTRAGLRAFLAKAISATVH